MSGSSSTPDRAQVQAVFDRWDANKDGTISKEEFRNMIQGISGKTWSEEQSSALFDAADVNRNGRLDFTELLSWIWSDEETHQYFSQETLSPAEERTKMQEITNQAAEGLKAGDQYFLVGRKWYVEWQEWVGITGSSMAPTALSRQASANFSGPMPQPALERTPTWTKERPGPIDNAELFDGDELGKLKRGITEHKDYEILSQQEWDLLHGWYKGGPSVKRRAITQPSGGVILELYGLSLKVFRSDNLAAGFTVMTESKTALLSAFKTHACEEFGLEVDKVRVWDYFNERKYANLENSMYKSLEDNRIYEDNEMLIECQDADGRFPVDAYPSGAAIVPVATAYTVPVSNEDVATAGVPPAPGVVGLRNLGNTCFMNSSIQCLSSLPELKAYFTDGRYRAETNETAYKTKGKLAEAYANLLEKMWDPGNTTVAPRNFKWQIGQFAEQFSGFGQQDSMEFVEYLLDGLKEDVNKVRGPKPFVETSEADGRADDLVAGEAADGYRKRNNSHIDDLFLGFFKSTVRCPEEACGRVSVTFDPYLSVKLSLVNAVEERSSKFNVLMVRTTGDVAPTHYEVGVPKSGIVAALIEAVAKSAGVDSQSCVLAEVHCEKIYKFFELADAIDRIRADDTLVCYELRDPVEFHMSFEERWNTMYDGSSGGTGGGGKLASSEMCGVVIQQRQPRPSRMEFMGRPWVLNTVIGMPLCTTIPKRTSGSALIQAVREELRSRIGDAADRPWKLFRTNDKWEISSTKKEVEDDEFELVFTLRQYLVIEWPEGAEVSAVDKLQQVLNTKFGGGAAASGGDDPSAVELQACFKMFTETDKLPETDAWYCNRCREHREAYKKMEFWSLPAHLCIQLKRFTYSDWSRDRLDTPVQFPMEGLDLSEYVVGPAEGPLIYDLAAVSVHMGGLGGGHYVAYGRSTSNGKWYNFNDSSVSEVSPATVAGDQTGAYVLFYVRRDHRPAGWGMPAV